MSNITVLRPDVVRNWQASLEDLTNPLALATSENISRLCRDYLTLWEQNRELKCRINDAICELGHSCVCDECRTRQDPK